MTKKTKIESGALIVLVLAAAGIWYRYKFQPSVSARVSSVITSYKPMGIASPALHSDRRAAARATEYKTTGRNIFLAQAPPPPSDPGATASNGRKEPYGPPVLPDEPPPQLPLKFYGSGIVPVGSSRRAFLTDGEEVYIVAEGDTLLGRYKILRISASNLEFEEISTHRHGSKPLDEQGPSA